MRYYIHIGVFDPETKRYYSTYTTQSYRGNHVAIREADLLADMLNPVRCKAFSCVFVTTTKREHRDYYLKPIYVNEFGF